MTTGKTIPLTIWIFVGKVMHLPFHALSRLVIAFLPRSNCLLISLLQSLSAVILEPRKIKSVTVSSFSPFLYHEVMGPDAVILVFWMLSFKPGLLYILLKKKRFIYLVLTVLGLYCCGLSLVAKNRELFFTAAEPGL